MDGPDRSTMRSRATDPDEVPRSGKQHGSRKIGLRQPQIQQNLYPPSKALLHRRLEALRNSMERIHKPEVAMEADTPTIDNMTSRD